MPLFEWDDSLALGIPEIDAQHRVLLDLLNALYEAILAREPGRGYRDALDGALAYARDHFLVEEELMRRSSYPRLDKHVLRHQEFVDKMAGLAENADEPGSAEAEDMLEFLRDWLIGHIMGGDQTFARYYLKRCARG